ncbi:4-(cytidine 5'-diphospho)-2-C-methyl-D-erythritol kinase [Anaerotalea alkaliphila]|uniref:4-diphosphocytidyl-2-C-methyl-D-erythritol kinase n=1 Tax=Anaerotalea alkaliphila TaxID=2662126 RepID=A0A7X5HU83_9FIRM|nr:4-(cytidine 5'-diphospho)-2-C-methyl-D-erythritol kinase [Anaerotalea alkaliphila]
MNQIEVKARAKINISLDVLGKRPDGYHDVRMVMQTLELYDRLNFKKIRGDKVILKTNIPYLPTDERNLVNKIVGYMKERYKIRTGVFVRLKKVIPVAAGLAGGSADAAETVKAMNRLFHLGLSLEEMMEIGGRFGADIPYCMVGGTALAEGIGEKITYLPDFPECHVVLVKPNFGVSTAHVFGRLDAGALDCHPDTEGVLEGIRNRDLAAIGRSMGNVLETVTVAEHPLLADIKKTLLVHGAIGALMSGSGPSVYGLFAEEAAAQEAARRIIEKKMAKFVRTTKIHNRKKVGCQ